jgi:hypothetical protein
MALRIAEKLRFRQRGKSSGWRLVDRMAEKP